MVGVVLAAEAVVHQGVVVAEGAAVAACAAPPGAEGASAVVALVVVDLAVGGEHHGDGVLVEVGAEAVAGAHNLYVGQGGVVRSFALFCFAAYFDSFHVRLFHVTEQSIHIREGRATMRVYVCTLTTSMP